MFNSVVSKINELKLKENYSTFVMILGLIPRTYDWTTNRPPPLSEKVGTMGCLLH